MTSAHVWRTLAAVGLVIAWRPTAGQRPKAQPKSPSPSITAKQVMERASTSLGSHAAWAKLRTSSISGSVEVPSDGRKGTVLIKTKRPDRMLVVQTFAASETRQGYDGRIAWSKDPVRGLRVLRGTEYVAVRLAATFDAHLRWKKLYKRMDYVGVRAVGKRSAHVVRLWPGIGRPTVEYHDTRTYRLLRTDITTEIDQGVISAQVYPSNYRSVSGVLVPFTVRTQLTMPDGKTSFVVMRVRSAQANVPIPDAVFGKPSS